MKIKIDGREIDVIPGETILEAAKKAGIYIPTLCYNEAFGGKGHCRMCMVEVTNGNSVRIVASCTYPINSEIEVKTSTPAIDKIRRNIVMLLYKRASGSQMTEKLYKEYGCEPNVLIEAPNERCILCNLCVYACEQMGSSAISTILRGTDKRVASPYDEASPACIGCGACAEVCPTGAIEMIETNTERQIWNKNFALVTCERCGRSFATREQLEYLAAKIGQEGYSERLCESCRKKAVAEKINQFNM